MLTRNSSIFHLCVFAPNLSGMYESVKDLIFAERESGLSASFIDTGDGECEGVEDNLIPIPLRHYRFADVLCWHHKICDEAIERSKNVLFLHGNPESAFYKGFHGDDGIYPMFKKLGNNPNFFKFFYFWKRHRSFWLEFFPKNKLIYIPIWYDGNRVAYQPNKPQGRPFVLGLCDYWRYGKEMFYLLHSLPYIKQLVKHPIQIKLIGMSDTCNKQCWISLINGLIEKGVVEIVGHIPNLNSKIGEMFDMVLTQTPDASRVVREALFAGVPVFCGDTAAEYTKFKYQSTDVKAFAKAVSHYINNFISQKGYWQVERRRCRKYAEKNFDIQRSVQLLKTHYEEIIRL